MAEFGCSMNTMAAVVAVAVVADMMMTDCLGNGDRGADHRPDLKTCLIALQQSAAIVALTLTYPCMLRVT
jgi:hypothetical protein